MMMDKQDIFDKVAVHLLTQMKKSKDECGKCVYRAHDGCKCAIGVLIPDDKYNEDLEGLFASDNAVLMACGVAPFNSEFLYFMQGIHDWRNPEEWEKELTMIADEFNLSTAAIDNLK